MPPDAAPARSPVRRPARRWLRGVALLATLLGLGLASPAVAWPSAVASADEGVHLEESVQRRATGVARRSVTGRLAGRVPARGGGPWPRRLVRSLRSLRSPRPPSTRGPPRGPASA